VGGGLGGGSSNAAAVIFALSRISQMMPTSDELIKISSEIGADVPFFLFRSPAYVSGIGEIMEDAPPLPEWTFLLVRFDFEVKTAWAYSAWDLTTERKGDNLVFPGARDPLPVPKRWRNDLESLVTARYPEIAAAKKALIDAGCEGAMMSGSGPTVFGVFADEAAAREAGEDLCRSLGGAVELAHALKGLVIIEAV